MNQTILVRRETFPSEAVAVTLSLFLVLGQVCNLTAQAQGRQSLKKSALTADQRAAHVLSRLMFGARPGGWLGASRGDGGGMGQVSGCSALTATASP